MAELTQFEKAIKEITDLAEELEYDVVEAMEEGEGGTITLRNITYSIMIDVEDDGSYSLSTLKEEDEEESNFKEVKTLKGVKGYLKKFGHDWNN